ncbi:Alg9-like mannosyltransferase family-domain-containing protein [Phycomyces nitens]|nr:Alg9-like mannosyltransferase family-domain-containing protein [Phycomyces nitens]
MAKDPYQAVRQRNTKRAPLVVECDPNAKSAAEAKAARDLLSESGTFTLSLKSAFRVLLIIRCASALYRTIADCDEVFNYWEPLHYLQNGYGFETWEYSPEFSIRSWAYIVLHAIVGVFGKIFVSNKLQSFYLLRMALGAFSSFAEAKFYRTVTEEVNPHVGRYILVILFFSAGMFNASTALLPSTFAMYTTFLAYSYILRPPNHIERGRTYKAVFWLGLGALVGWPFSAVVGVPFAIEEILVFGRDTTTKKDGSIVQVLRTPNWRLHRLVRLIEAVVLCGAAISIPIVLIDRLFYQRWTFVPLNIVLYNVFGSDGRGPELYGTEPWYYYIVNGFLNFNIVFLLALGSALCVCVTAYIDRNRIPGTRKIDVIWPYVLLGLKLVPFYIWFTIFSLQAHKEERFLFVAYPLVALNGAISLYLIRSWASRVAGYFGAKVETRAAVLRYTSLAVLIVFGFLSVSRILAVITRYSAPLKIFGSIWDERAPDQLFNLDYLQEDYPTDLSKKTMNLCVGKEWHRFPSNYFMPSDVRVRFIKSDFDGALPKSFVEDIGASSYLEVDGERVEYRPRLYKFEGASAIQPFNDLNKGDPSVYVPLSECDYLVDSDFPLRPLSVNEPPYVQDTATWETMDCYPFLDAQNSHQLARAFWIPDSQGLKWGSYCLLKKRQ